MDNKYLSRKFILTVLFFVATVCNYWFFDAVIPWEALVALAIMLGVYTGANAYQNGGTVTYVLPKEDVTEQGE